MKFSDLHKHQQHFYTLLRKLTVTFELGQLSLRSLLSLCCYLGRLCGFRMFYTLQMTYKTKRWAPWTLPFLMMKCLGFFHTSLTYLKPCLSPIHSLGKLELSALVKREKINCLQKTVNFSLICTRMIDGVPRHLPNCHLDDYLLQYFHFSRMMAATCS